MIQRDKYQREIAEQIKDKKALKDFVDEVLERIDKIDLRSFDFDKDPDMNYKSIV